MRKLDSLREFLTASLPALRKEPERLQLFADEGRVACTPGGGLSFEYRYKVTLQLWDFAGDVDAVVVPLLVWIGREQPELLKSFKTNPEAISFRAEVLDAQKVDLEIALDLTEAVKVTRRPDGSGCDVEHLAEPVSPASTVGVLAAPDTVVRAWSLWLAGEKVAEWTGTANEAFP